MGTSGTSLLYVIVDRMGAINNVPFDNTTPIYLINLLWNRVTIRVRLRVALFLAFFTENNEYEHVIFREFHTR